ncbi:CoA-binding protein [Aureitalea marina]|uniref:CoA-binding protein n=1 Tax=Aureitalea marina TaxID=930804 RepID=A0A2S7KQ89_9FLAO|nr:CoA-binding protein [Aureitalea marina]PQB04785.1 CoA-binding protein [Aureitalea marina]
MNLSRSISEAAKTLVLGASTNTNRYSYLAIKRLLEHGHQVVGVGRDEAEVLGVHISSTLEPVAGIDTVTIYVNPTNQYLFADYILSLKPRRVIFNPGSENPSLYAKLLEADIDVEVACTLVLLGTEQY